MPCGGRGGEPLRGRIPAVLCGVLTALEDEDGLMLPALFDKLDWKEVGVSRAQVEAWWRNHKEDDEARREEERERAQKHLAREKILAQLSPETRAILGV